MGLRERPEPPLEASCSPRVTRGDIENGHALLYQILGNHSGTTVLRGSGLDPRALRHSDDSWESPQPLYHGGGPLGKHGYGAYPPVVLLDAGVRAARATPHPSARGSMPSRRKTLAGLFAIGICSFLSLNLFSCGAGLCIHNDGRRFVDVSELVTEVVPQVGHEFAAYLPGNQHAGEASGDSGPPMLIPRILHQTHKTTLLPSSMAGSIAASWPEQNGPAWKYHMWDDADCLAMVSTEFPEYLEAYKRLPNNVERADFFRWAAQYRNPVSCLIRVLFLG